MLGELDICVLYDLHAVAPWIPELHSSPGQELDAGLFELPSDLLFIVHHEAKVALLLWMLSVRFEESNKLIPHFDEGHLLAAPAQRELEHPAIKSKCFLDVPDLQGHVVDADQPCLFVHFSRLRSCLRDAQNRMLSPFSMDQVVVTKRSP